MFITHDLCAYSSTGFEQALSSNETIACSKPTLNFTMHFLWQELFASSLMPWSWDVLYSRDRGGYIIDNSLIGLYINRCEKAGIFKVYIHKSNWNRCCLILSWKYTIVNNEKLHWAKFNGGRYDYMLLFFIYPKVTSCATLQLSKNTSRCLREY